MPKPPTPTLETIDGIPAHELLEGLGNLHQSVVVTRTDGTVEWVSRSLLSELTGEHDPVGASLTQLCHRYIDAGADRNPGASDLRQTSSEQPRLQVQISDVFAQLERRQWVCHRTILSDAHSLAPKSYPDRELELSAFSVRRRSAEAEPNSDELLYVTILRQSAKADLLARVDTAPHDYFRSVLDQLPEATLTIDQSGFITYANSRTVALLGKSAFELIDSPVSLFFSGSAILPLKPSGPDASDPENMDSPFSSRTVAELVRPKGDAVYVEVASRPLNLPDGTYAGRIIQLRDTSNQRRTVERFKQKISSLEAYVHTVSHDLRSPLVSMLGFTRIVKQDYGKFLDETGRKFLDRIEQAGANMNTMTQDLLELSTRDQHDTTPEPVDPRNILLQIQAEVKPRLQEQGVDLILPSLPPMIQCDRTQLYQIFSNLIGNALTHMGPHAAPRIEIDIEEHDDEHVIVVQDNGVGIDRCEHQRIFEAFHSNSRPSASRSTGVGLAIVKKIAQDHGGQVWVESEPGEGATFFVSLTHV